MNKGEEAASRIERRIRFDLIIAVCALLISTLATGAAWWQARVVEAQTRVLQEQLGAQVWPYMSVSAGIDNDTVRISASNDGLGPAVVRSFSATIDRLAEYNFIDILHAVLGPNLVARSRARGDSLSIGIDNGTPGTVVRPGEANIGFSLRSKLYARAFLSAYKRVSFRICYCAIIPGKCWLSDSKSSSDPVALTACPELRNDLLHAPVFEELLSRTF